MDKKIFIGLILVCFFAGFVVAGVLVNSAEVNFEPVFDSCRMDGRFLSCDFVIKTYILQTVNVTAGNKVVRINLPVTSYNDCLVDNAQSFCVKEFSRNLMVPALKEQLDAERRYLDSLKPRAPDHSDDLVNTNWGREMDLNQLGWPTAVGVGAG